MFPAAATAPACRRAHGLAHAHLHTCTPSMTPAKPMHYDIFETPPGRLSIAADAAGLRHVLFPHTRHGGPGREHWRHAPEQLAEARRPRLEHFAGRRRVFDLPLAPVGTPSQLDVRAALRKIPSGSTWSCRQLAQQLDKPATMHGRHRQRPHPAADHPALPPGEIRAG